MADKVFYGAWRRVDVCSITFWVWSEWVGNVKNEYVLLRSCSASLHVLCKAPLGFPLYSGFSKYKNIGCLQWVTTVITFYFFTNSFFLMFSVLQFSINEKSCVLAASYRHFFLLVVSYIHMTDWQRVSLNGIISMNVMYLCYDYSFFSPLGMKFYPNK